jgi:hypothetical protein
VARPRTRRTAIAAIVPLEIAIARISRLRIVSVIARKKVVAANAELAAAVRATTARIVCRLKGVQVVQRRSDAPDARSDNLQVNGSRCTASGGTLGAKDCDAQRTVASSMA